jgi:hypothetical protein
MNYTYCSHGNYWHACSDQECANLGHVTTAVCEYCKLKDVRTEATMNKRGFELCQKCYDSQAKAERESDEFNEQFYKNQAATTESKSASYLGPQSNYYLDKTWDEYHKMKEELADERNKRKQIEDMYDSLQDMYADLKMRVTPLIKAAHELEHSYHDVYAVNRVREASANIRNT